MKIVLSPFENWCNFKQWLREHRKEVSKGHKQEMKEAWKAGLTRQQIRMLEEEAKIRLNKIFKKIE